MDEPTRQSIVALREMFGSQGWKLLCEDLEHQRDQIQAGTILSAQDERALYFAKGAYQVLSYILGYADAVDAVEQSNAAEEDEYAPAPV